jgi:tetratricopeptide (TPR) repeat protein
LQDERGPVYAIASVLLLAFLGGWILPAGPLESALALLSVFLVGVIALRVGGRPGLTLALLGLAGVWLVFREGGLGVVLARQAAYYAVAPLLVHWLMSDHAERRLGITPFHIYAPMAVAFVLVGVHITSRLSNDLPPVGEGLEQAGFIYRMCYAALVPVVLLARLSHRPVEKAAPTPAVRAELLEEQGRFGMASRQYERDQQLEKAAEMAERAGEWARAADLLRRSGSAFQAAEMFYRAGKIEEALLAYERAQAWPAAARLCQQLGQHEKAAAFFERAGDMNSSLAALQAGGAVVGPEQFRRARQFDRAAAAYAEQGDWIRAAEIYEHDLFDLEKAAQLHLQGKSFLQAGRLLEQLARPLDALDAYLGSPEGSAEALRVCLAQGLTERAAQIVLQLPAQALERVEDEATMMVVAEALLEAKRDDDAIRLLQKVKRQGTGGGAMHLLLGRSLLAKGMPDLAEEELRIAARLPMDGKREIEAAYLLACTLEAAHKDAEEVEVLRTVLQPDFLHADAEARYRRLKAKLEATSSP